MAMKYPKWFDVLCAIDEACWKTPKQNYLEKLTRVADVASSYLKCSVNNFNEEGLIEKEQEKNRKYIFLTEKGKELSVCIKQFKTILGN